MFLDDEELYILTGYRWHSKQVVTGLKESANIGWKLPPDMRRN